MQTLELTFRHRVKVDATNALLGTGPFGANGDFVPPWNVSHPILLDPVMWMIGTAVWRQRQMGVSSGVTA